MKQELVDVKRAVGTFGYPLSNVVCKCCGAKMYEVARTVKKFGGVMYGFEGFKCTFCGHEHVEHVLGGVLGDVKE